MGQEQMDGLFVEISISMRCKFYNMKGFVPRVPTHFQKQFSILFRYLFNTNFNNSNTITSLHFPKFYSWKTRQNICKTVMSSKEQNLNKK